MGLFARPQGRETPNFQLEPLSEWQPDENTDRRLMSEVHSAAIGRSMVKVLQRANCKTE